MIVLISSRIQELIFGYPLEKPFTPGLVFLLKVIMLQFCLPQKVGF